MKLMRSPNPLLTILLLGFVNGETGNHTDDISFSSDYPTAYRPAIHFTPPHGFMNDPNGLIHDERTNLYHMYYQCNPEKATFGNQHWCHATSTDLYTWRDHPIAMSPTEKGYPFSGTVVDDVNNTSGLFPNSNSSNFVVVYTRHGKEVDQVVIGYSADNGMSFQDFDNNPVIDLNLRRFQDPQVFWYPEDQKWVMVVALSRNHILHFYESSDLIHWHFMSDFQGGILGVDYECPNLVPVLSYEGDLKWVLFISVNPGMPQGGSGTQYFVGNFNGTHFTLDTHQRGTTATLDFAKDNYALQYINPGSRAHQYESSREIAQNALYVSWLSNWDYAALTPTLNWRGVMSVPRKLSVLTDWLDVSRLVQEPFNIQELGKKKQELRNLTIKSDTPSPPISLHEFGSTALKLELEGAYVTEAAPHNVTLDVFNSDPGSHRFVLQIYNDHNEQLEIGIDPKYRNLWLDRGKTAGFTDPFFTDKFSAALNEYVPEFNLCIILDASVIEVYAENGLTTGSATFYTQHPLTHAQLQMHNGGRVSANFSVQALQKTMPRQTWRESIDI